MSVHDAGLLKEVTLTGNAGHWFIEAHANLKKELPLAAIICMRRCLIASCIGYNDALCLPPILLSEWEGIVQTLRGLRVEITEEQERNLDFISRNMLSDENDLGSDKADSENAEVCFRTTAEVYKKLLNGTAEAISTWKHLSSMK